MIFASWSKRRIVNQEEYDLAKTLSHYGFFTCAEIGASVWYADLECQPSPLSPITQIRPDKMDAMRGVERQLQRALVTAIDVPEWDG